MNTRLTLGQLVPLYTFGPGALTKRDALRFIIESRTSRQQRTGRGNRAARRCARLCEDIGHSIMAINRRAKEACQRRHSDVMAEAIPESRSLSHLLTTNIHE